MSSVFEDRARAGADVESSLLIRAIVAAAFGALVVAQRAALEPSKRAPAFGDALSEALTVLAAPTTDHDRGASGDDSARPAG